MLSPFRQAFLLLTVLLLPACGGRGSAASGVVTSDSAGVTIVTSPGEDRELGWTFTEESRIGGKDDGPESFGSVHYSVVGVDGSDNIHVLDLTASQVHRFGRDGRHLVSFGRKGDGPGEMQWAGALAVTPDGADMVYDFAGGRLVSWDPAGNLLPGMSTRSGGFPGRLDGGLAWRGDTIAYVRYLADTAMNVNEITVLTPRDTTSISRLTVARPRMVDFGCVGVALPPYFTNSLGMALGDGVIAATLQTRYEIDVYRGGRLFRSVRRAIDPRPATVDDVAALYPDGFKFDFGGGAGCTIEIAEAVEKVGIAPTYPLVSRMLFGPGGELWVQRFLPNSDPPVVDVFDADGGYLGSYSGRPLPVGFFSDGRVLMPLTDEDTDVVALGIVRIDREPATR